MVSDFHSRSMTECKKLTGTISSPAPWVFQGIWKLLAPMLDPVVRNKIVRRSSASEEETAELTHSSSSQQMTKSTNDLVEHIPKVSFT
jgi:hypothetical protein